ncbi:MAG: bluetail domain-containing putative surface protein [Cyanobacteriota bacterium]|jgi:Ca2+-binding RTX toxin-like protein
MTFNIEFDYRFDTQGFFSSPLRKNLLEEAASIWESYIQDDFSSIPAGETINVPVYSVTTSGNSYTITPNYQSAPLNAAIDDILIFVYSLSLPSGVNTLGSGGPFGSWFIGSERDNRFNGNDFEPWVGSIYFNSTANFFFDSTPSTSDDIPFNESDFLSTALHEIGHVLGIGTAPAFSEQITNQKFNGAASRALNGGQSVPLSPDLGHIKDGFTLAGVSDYLMDPIHPTGTRQAPRDLDLALLQDIGYEVVFPSDSPSVTLSVSPTSVFENGAASLIYTFIRSGETTNALTINYTVSGTATFNTDYTQSGAASFSTTAGTIIFGAGATTATLNIAPTPDSAVENNETIILTLAQGNGYSIGATASVTGTILNDDSTFTGTVGNDSLNGTTGADTLIGLAGNDTYTVNHIGDIVTENLNEGTDTVKSDIGYTLPDNVEKLTLNGSANLNGTGNALKNTLTGNAGNNILTGLAGNDTLDGKAGADTMVGGLGNDTYTVDNAGDVVTENANEGADAVKASISYTLGANLENLTLTGSANLNGTGNALKNKITGNTGANILNGGAGADTLAGKAGNDIFVFQFGQSIVTAQDRVSDFAIGADKIDLLTQGGAVMNAPVAFTRAANSATTNINTIVNNVFADADGASSGSQVLAINSAALVRANTSTYLMINDGMAGFQSANDLVINLTGLTGALPALGSIPVSNFFI